VEVRADGTLGEVKAEAEAVRPRMVAMESFMFIGIFTCNRNFMGNVVKFLTLKT
jgi:hypothetical protein